MLRNNTITNDPSARLEMTDHKKKQSELSATLCVFLKKLHPHWRNTQNLINNELKILTKQADTTLAAWDKDAPDRENPNVMTFLFT